MSDININITADEEPKVHMNIMETVPVGKYEEKANKKQGMEEVTDFEAQFLSAGAIQKIKEEILKNLNDKEDVSNKLTLADINDGKWDVTDATDEQYLSALASQVLLEGVISKIVTIENELPYLYATKEEMNNKEDVANKTLGGNYPITHPDCTIAEDEYYASLKYLKECFDYFKDQIDASGGGGNVDLSDYYTKEQTDEKIGDIEALLGGI